MTAAVTVSRLAESAADAAIETAAKTLQLPTIRAQAGVMAAAAAKQRLSHKAFLAEMLNAECDERDARRLSSFLCKWCCWSWLVAGVSGRGSRS